jgi:chromosome segregation ATPase
VKQLKIELSQLQHQVREVPGLKNELHKNRQQMSHLNEIVIACRRENNTQKTLIGKMQKDLASKEARAKQHLEECDKHTKGLQKDVSEKEKMILELKQFAEKNSQEIDEYKLQCETLCSIIGRLEVRILII